MATQDTDSAATFQHVAVVGMGYVGLTLAAALAREGYTVHGVDTQPAVVNSLSQGRSHIFEPGVAEVFAKLTGERIFVRPDLPAAGADVAIISVATPVDETTHEPSVKNLAAAAEHVAACCAPGTLVVVRSTVPVGTSREVVLPALEAAWGRPHVRLVMAPERTIQGRALREIVELPQVVGGLDDASRNAGLAFFGGFARQVVPVSSLETAELVKLTNNCHTDVIYSFGNEIAMISDRLGLDPLEVIRATNLDYPRPDIARPGYVGGGCLSKDPYILIASSDQQGYQPGLVSAARGLNEALPGHVAHRVVTLLREVGGATLAVLGWAYKGWPPTDDMRGTPIAAMMPEFTRAGVHVLGHDPLVRPEIIAGLDGEPVSLPVAFERADAVLLITDHPDYRALDLDTMLTGSNVKLIYDSWRILDAERITARGIRYAGLGYAAPVAPPFLAEVAS